MEKVVAELADKIFDLIKVTPDIKVEEKFKRAEDKFRNKSYEISYDYILFKNILDEYYLNVAKKYAESLFEIGIKIGINFKDTIDEL